MTSWEIATRLRKISRMIPFSEKITGSLRYLDAATLLFSLDLDDVHEELITHFENTGVMDKKVCADIFEMLKSENSTIEMNLMEYVPKGIRNLLHLDNLRPATVSQLYYDLGIETIDELKRAFDNNILTGKKSLGKRFSEQLRHHLTLYYKGNSSLFLYKAEYLANLIKRRIEKTNLTSSVLIVGDVRRGKEEITNIDILCVAEKPNINLSTDLMNKLGLPKSEITNSGFSAIYEKMNVRIHFCKEKYLGSVLVFFTGPNEHYDKLSKKIGHAKRVKAGFFKILGDEKTFYKKLGLSYIPPEVREWEDAIELTEAGKTWNLLELEDIQGDLHVHTTWSDGRSNFKQLGYTAKNHSLNYISITDHAQKIKVARGIDLVSLKKQIKILQKMNSYETDFAFIPGIELNIDKSGEIDYTLRENILKLGAIHSEMGCTPSEIENRYINAIRSGNINIIAHPSGRKLKVRDEFDVDWKKIFTEAAKNNVAIELNYAPDRMDLRWELARIADEAECKFTIGGDIHFAGQLNHIKYGAKIAKRAGLSSEKVLNCLPARELRLLLWNNK